MTIIEKFNLDNGIILHNIHNMDGGGSTHYTDFLEIVSTVGKKHYARALEWCSGPGFIGYAFLCNKICEHIVFMDKYAPAIDSCVETANQNNLIDNITTYVADAIYKLPSIEKFDLVLGNPPHMWDRDIFLNETRKNYEQNNHTLTEEHIEVLERLLLDHNQDIHIEFFSHITEHLLPEADLFISEPGDSKNMPEIVEYAVKNDLIFVGEYPMPTMKNCAPNATLLHFRSKP